MKFRKLPSLLLLLGLLAFLFPSISQADTPEPAPETVYFCSESKEIYGTISILKSRSCAKAEEFQSVWHLSQAKKDLAVDQIQLIACTSKNSNLKYFSVKKECRNYQKSNYYYRVSKSVFLRPVILETSNVSRSTVDLTVQIPDMNADAPVKYFEVSALSVNAPIKQIIEKTNVQAITVRGLNPGTEYRFTIKAFSIDGVSPESLESLQVKTLPPPPPPPAFELSSTSEIGTQNSAITGFTVSQTGGRVDAFSISPAIEPASGLIFDSVTGSLTGTPVNTMSEVVYTITGTNESGSDTATFTLTVNMIPMGPTALSLQVFFLLTLLWLGFIYLRRRFTGWAF
jgi:hypothetical protein